jgi:hypothetical protein
MGSEGKRLEMVQVLLANPRTDVHSVDSDGQSALTVAEDYGQCKMAVLLNQHVERTETRLPPDDSGTLK